MNSKIKELLSPKFIEWGADSDDNFSEELEKFAVLIVQECARIAAEVGDGNVKLGYLVPRECSDKIKEHFGVK